MRAFVAILLDDATRAALARLPRPAPPRGVQVRWVAERNLHLTLKFLGEVEEERIPAVAAALRAASVQAKPFTMEVAGTGAFPERGAPRVLWAGCDGGTALVALAAAVEQGLERIGFERERRPFSAHVTLARVTGRAPGPLLPPERRDRAFGQVQVRSLSLMRSTLRTAGAVYEEVERCALGPGRAGP